jgi:lysozyme
MKTDNNGINLITHYEGIKLTPYLCPAGYVTVGVGKVLLDNKGNMLKGQSALDAILKTWKLKTKEELINDFRVNDLPRYEKQLNSLNIQFTQYQYDALISFIYNVGFNALLKSTLLKKIKLKATSIEITNEFLKWNKGGGKILSGLTNRRKSEALLFTTGELKFLIN